MIELKQLTVRFGEKVIFHDFNLTLPDHGIVTVMGESGIGKTTLLRVLSHTLRPQKGVIAGLEGRRVSVAYQEPRLLEWKSALDNVALVSDRETARRLLCALSMQEAMAQPASELSGGQKQRVSLARAFAFGNDVVLLDEPFAGLDEENKRSAAELIRTARLAVVVTHDPSDLELLSPNKKINL